MRSAPCETGSAKAEAEVVAETKDELTHQQERGTMEIRRLSLKVS